MRQSYKIHINQSLIYLAGSKEFLASVQLSEKAVQLIRYKSPQQLDRLITALEVVESARPILIIHKDLQLLKTEFFGQFKLIRASGGLVLNQKGAYLMIFRKGQWDLPKGKIELKEGKREAAAREVEEETGVHVLETGKKICTTYHTYNLNQRRLLKKSYWYEMKGDANSQLIPQTKEDITAVKWVGGNDLGEYLEESWPSIWEVFQNYLRARRGSEQERI